MRVEKREIATEIFHRLKAKEQTFDQLGLIYGLGKERFKGSYFESQCLSALPKKLIPYAKMLKEGQMSDPIEIGKNIYALFRLENYAAATLNEENKLAIYKLHFEEWCRYILPSLHSTIRANL